MKIQTLPFLRAAPGDPGVSPEIADQAVRWLIELQAGAPTDALREAWQRWRREDPEHERAWRHIESVNERLKGVPGPLSAALLRQGHRSGRRRAVKLLLLVAAGGAAGWTAKDSGLVRGWTSDYATRVGERRAVTLPDGSRVTLNTDSAIDLEFDREQRRVRLLGGEILVQTAADPVTPTRPFLVHTKHGRLRALGTRFNVRVHDGGSDLAVFEGAVELRPADRPDPPLVVHAGRQAVLERAGWRDLGPLRESAGAWSEGMLVASDMPLGEFLGELSRYRAGRLSCAPEVAHLRVSGTYPLGDTERILGALQRALPVRVRYFTRYWVSVQPADA